MSAYTDHDTTYGWNEVTQKHVVLENIIWEIGKKGSNYFYVIPAGFEFDVSVPKGFGWLLNRHDRKVLKAAALHDHLLEFGWLPQTASGEFLNALIADKVEFLRSRFYYICTVLLHTFIKHDRNKKHYDHSQGIF